MRRLLLRHLAVALIIAMALLGIYAQAGNAPRPLWFVAVALAVGVGSAAVQLVLEEVSATSWPDRDDEAMPAARSVTGDRRTDELAKGILGSGRERRAGAGAPLFVRRVRPLLAELARDRLVRRHGVDPVLEPDRARQLTGDAVWKLITDTRPRTASLAEIERAVEAIERL